MICRKQCGVCSENVKKQQTVFMETRKISVVVVDVFLVFV